MAQEYFTGSITNVAGTLYAAIADNVGSLPPSANWKAAGLPDVVSQAEAEAGTSTVVRSWTAERVKQAIVALGTSIVQATEAVAGKAKIAAQAITDAGTNDTDFVTNTLFPYPFILMQPFNMTSCL